MNKPWDAPDNSAIEWSHVVIGEYLCPSDADGDRLLTNYVAVIGEKTMWPGETPATPAADGSDDDKILLIEVVDSDIRWIEPRDLTLEQALDSRQKTSGMRIGSRHPAGINYVTVGGQVRTLPHNIDRESLWKLLVRDPPKAATSSKKGPE